MTALDLLLAREAQIRRDLADPAVTEIDIPTAFCAEQVGMRRLMLDPIGRFWDVDTQPAKMIFDPHAETRKMELDRG